MAVRKILARGWAFEIGDGAAVPTFTQIGGLNSWSRSREQNNADTTDFDSQGWMEHLPASRSGSVTVEGLMKMDPADGTRDPGQQACEDAAEQVGVSAYRQFRLYHVDSGKGLQGEVSVGINEVGGGNDDPTSWGATFQLNGQWAAYTVV